jgi:hypothetical protein
MDPKFVAANAPETSRSRAAKAGLKKGGEE